MQAVTWRAWEGMEMGQLFEGPFGSDLHHLNCMCPETVHPFPIPLLGFYSRILPGYIF
jgi:hypothetical protein